MKTTLIILIATTITLTTLATLNIQNLTQLFTKTEQIEIIYTNIHYEDNKPVITIKLANKGTTQQQITTITINNHPLNITQLPFTIHPGNTLTIKIIGTQYLKPGNTYKITITTNTGKTYTKLYKIP